MFCLAAAGSAALVRVLRVYSQHLAQLGVWIVHVSNNGKDCPYLGTERPATLTIDRTPCTTLSQAGYSLRLTLKDVEAHRSMVQTGQIAGFGAGRDISFVITDARQRNM